MPTRPPRNRPAQAGRAAGWSLVGPAAVCLAGLAAAASTVHPVLAGLALPVGVCLRRAWLLPAYARAARTDAKTGLADATAWEQTVHRELHRARRQASPVGVLLVDLDHFKALNDTHGHLTGDRVLRAVAAVLTETVRGYDCAGRFGGEEFVVVLPGLAETQTLAVAERIRGHVSRLAVPTGSGAELVQVRASIGAAVYPVHGETLTELLAAADAALYAAKRSGRDQVRLAEVPRTAPSAS